MDLGIVPEEDEDGVDGLRVAAAHRGGVHQGLECTGHEGGQQCSTCVVHCTGEPRVEARHALQLWIGRREGKQGGEGFGGWGSEGGGREGVRIEWVSGGGEAYLAIGVGVCPPAKARQDYLLQPRLQGTRHLRQ